MPWVAVDEFFSWLFSVVVVVGFCGLVGVWSGCCGGEEEFCCVVVSPFLGLKRENISEKCDNSLRKRNASSEFFKLLKSGFIVCGKSGCCER